MHQIKNNKSNTTPFFHEALLLKPRLHPYQYRKPLKVILDENFQSLNIFLLRKKKISIRRIDFQITKQGLALSKVFQRPFALTTTLRACLRYVDSANFKASDLEMLKKLVFHLKFLRRCQISITKPNLERHTYKDVWFMRYAINPKIERLSLNFDHVPLFTRKFMIALRKKENLKYFELNFKYSKYVFLDFLVLFEYVQNMKRLNHFKLKPLIIGDRETPGNVEIPFHKLKELKSMKIFCPNLFYQLSTYQSLFKGIVECSGLQSLSMDLEGSLALTGAVLKEIGGILGRLKSVSSLRISFKANGEEIPNEFFYGLQDISLKTLILSFTKMKLRSIGLRLLGTAIIASQHLHKLGLSFSEMEVQGSIFETLSVSIAKLTELRDVRLSHPILYEETSVSPYQNLNKILPVQHLELEIFINWKAEERLGHLIELIEKQKKLVYLMMNLNSTSMHSRYSADISACEAIFKAIGKLERLKFLSMTVGKFRKNSTNRRLFLLDDILERLQKLKWLQLKLYGEYLDEVLLLDVASEITHMRSLRDVNLMVDVSNISPKGLQKFKKYVLRMERFDDIDINIVGKKDQGKEISELKGEIEKIKYRKLCKL